MPRLPVWTCVCQSNLPKLSVESEQDEAEIYYDQWSTTEWCNCEKCEKDINQLRMRVMPRNSGS